MLEMTFSSIIFPESDWHLQRTTPFDPTIKSNVIACVLWNSQINKKKKRENDAVYCNVGQKKGEGK